MTKFGNDDRAWEQALQRADRFAAGSRDQAGIAAAVSDLAYATPYQPAAATTRTKRKGWLVAVPLVMAVGFTTAAGYAVTAHTGVFGIGRGEEDSSEWIDLGAPDAAKVIAAQAPREIDLPAGLTWDQGVTDQLGQLDNLPAEGARRQLDGIKFGYVSWATCAWETNWIASVAKGNKKAAKKAETEAREINDLPITVSHDGGNYREYNTDMYDAAAAGDLAMLRQSVSVNCPADMARTVGPVITQEHR